MLRYLVFVFHQMEVGKLYGSDMRQLPYQQLPLHELPSQLLTKVQNHCSIKNRNTTSYQYLLYYFLPNQLLSNSPILFLQHCLPTIKSKNSNKIPKTTRSFHYMFLRFRQLFRQEGTKFYLIGGSCFNK